MPQHVGDILGERSARTSDPADVERRCRVRSVGPSAGADRQRQSLQIPHWSVPPSALQPT